jgi:hypothetical protein
MFYTNPYNINIQSSDFWIKTLNQMLLDSGHNLEKKVNQRVATAATPVIQRSFTMPIVFDRSNSWQWGNSDFSLINLSGLRINSGNTTVIQAPDQTCVPETDDERRRREEKEKQPNYVAIALVVAAFTGATFFLGYCHSRFKKFEVSHNFFSELRNQKRPIDIQDRSHSDLVSKLNQITSDYQIVSKLQKDFYEGQVFAAFIDVVALAILAGAYSFVAPQIITLGFFILAAGLGAGLLSYGMHLGNADRIKSLYEGIFKETKAALTLFKQWPQGQAVYPLATPVALGQKPSYPSQQHYAPQQRYDVDTAYSAPEPSAPPEGVSDAVLGYFDEDPTPLA